MSTTKRKEVLKKFLRNQNKQLVEFKVEHTFVRKAWGYEVWFANNDLYCGKLLHLNRKARSSEGRMHYHKIKDETFYVIKGTLVLDFIKDDRLITVHLRKGDSVRLDPNTPHRFSAGFFSCDFIEASTHHEDSDSYYLPETAEWFDRMKGKTNL
jgi:mannose-6-phosphate isomerase-like protein (cupin superfamily)